MSQRDRLELRDAVNVSDLKRRDKIVREIRRIRANAVLDKNTFEHINRIHPDWKPIDTSFEQAIIAWCDGKGPMPSVPPPRISPTAEGTAIARRSSPTEGT